MPAYRCPIHLNGIILIHIAVIVCAPWPWLSAWTLELPSSACSLTWCRGASSSSLPCALSFFLSTGNVCGLEVWGLNRRSSIFVNSTCSQPPYLANPGHVQTGSRCSGQGIIPAVRTSTYCKAWNIALTRDSLVHVMVWPVDAQNMFSSKPHLSNSVFKASPLMVRSCDPARAIAKFSDADAVLRAFSSAG